MDRKTLITIFVLFLISSQLWSMLWDIGKGVIYILLLIFALSYLNPSVADEMKNIFKKIISLDFSFATKYITTGAKYIGDFLRNKISPKQKDLIPQEQTNLIPQEQTNLIPQEQTNLIPKEQKTQSKTLAQKITSIIKTPKTNQRRTSNQKTNVIRNNRRL
jgi:hypothetical protein